MNPVSQIVRLRFSNVNEIIDSDLPIHSSCCVVLGWLTVLPTHDADDGRIPLCNRKNLDGWHTCLQSTGKDNDPEGIFKVESGRIHILDIPQTGQEQDFGYLATSQEFSDVRIHAEYKWGAKRFPSRGEEKRDSGLLYLFGPDLVSRAPSNIRFKKPMRGIYFHWNVLP